MDNRFYTSVELATIIERGLDRASVSAWPLVVPPVCNAQRRDLDTNALADGKNTMDLAGPRRGIRTEWGFLTAIIGDNGDLSSLQIRLENDPWFVDLNSNDRENERNVGIYLSDILHFELGQAIGSDLGALNAAGAEWADIGSAYVAGELYMLAGASFPQIARVLACVLRRLDIAALIARAEYEAKST